MANAAPSQPDPGGIHRRRRRHGLSPSAGTAAGPAGPPGGDLRRRPVAAGEAQGRMERGGGDDRRRGSLRSDQIDAVVIATPNDTHRPIAVAAARAGKHIMCEKPLGLSAGEVREMYEAARDARVVHMTAFTYRFAPSMRYLRHLLKSGSLGTPRHFRSQRFLDWPETSWGWRQYKARAGAGDLFDMTIHRIDFAIDLLGPIARVCGAVARFAPRDRTVDGTPCPPSEVDDWSCLIGEFASGRPVSGRGRRWPRATIATASATSGPRSTARRDRPSTACTSRTPSSWARPARTLPPFPFRPSFSSPPAARATPPKGRRPRSSATT